MVNKYFVINNENGSVIVIAMLMLVILTILGVSSTNTSIIELHIATNEKIYQINFYHAESAAAEALQRLEAAIPTQLNDRTFSSFPWLKKFNTATDMTNTGNWNIGINSAASITFSNADYSVVEKGIARGESLDMTAPRMYEYIARGYSYSNIGNVLIEMGYKKRH